MSAKLNMTQNKISIIPKRIQASFWFMLCMIVQRSVSAVTIPIYTRIMSSDEYGIYATYLSWMSIAAVIVCLKLHEGVFTQGLVKFSEDSDRFVGSLQGLLVVLVLLWGTGYCIFHTFLNRALSFETPIMIAMIVTVWMDTAFGLWATEQRVNLSYKLLLCLTIVSAVAEPTISILMIRRFPGDAVLVRGISSAAVKLVLFGWIPIYHMIRGRVFCEIRWWKYAVSYNILLVPSFLSDVLLYSSDRIIIRSIVGNTESGIYDLASRVASLMLLVNAAIMQTMSPWTFQRIKTGELQKAKKLFLPLLILISSGNLVLVLFAPELVRIFAPQSYQNAVMVIPVIAMANYWMFAASIIGDVELYLEKKKGYLIASIVASALNISLNYLLIPCFGFMAAGYTTLGSYISYAVIHFVFAKYFCGLDTGEVFPYSFRYIVAVFACMVLISVLLTNLYDYLTIRIGVLVVGLVIIFGNRKRVLQIAERVLNNSSSD